MAGMSFSYKSVMDNKYDDSDDEKDSNDQHNPDDHYDSSYDPTHEVLCERNQRFWDWGGGRGSDVHMSKWN